VTPVLASPAVGQAPKDEWPLSLNAGHLTAQQLAAAKQWAADDRLWTTQETVEFNLRTFARVVLAAQPPVVGQAPATGLLTSELMQALIALDELEMSGCDMDCLAPVEIVALRRLLMALPTSHEGVPLKTQVRALAVSPVPSQEPVIPPIDPGRP
jgi:hypothetical protein